MIERHEKEIKEFLRSKGYFPRDNKSLVRYIYQLTARLKKEGKKIEMKETRNGFHIAIVRYSDKPKKDKKLSIRLEENKLKEYKDYASSKGMSLSELMVGLLEEDMNKKLEL